MWITLLIFFGICWTFILSTRDYICWKYVFGIRRKIWRFGIANISFSNQSDIKFEKKKKNNPRYLRGMTGDGAPSPGKREASRSRWTVVVLSGQDRAPGQGLARWVRPQKISTSGQGPQSGPSLGRTGPWQWDGYGERFKLKSQLHVGPAWSLGLLISSDDEVFHIQTAWHPLSQT